MPVSTRSTGALTCPACGAVRGRTFPASRKSGRVVAGCKDCGCHWLTNPPDDQEILDNYTFARDVYEAYVNAKRADSLDRAYKSTLQRLRSLNRSGGRALFDVGAGAGEFLVLAREEGFEPHGNEFAPGAIEMAKERTGIDLHAGDLSSIEGANLYDAVTMWCVLAHVTEPDELLRDALRVLKPGGILFLQTPRWSAMDTAALGLARVSGGRLVRVLDRRISEFHMTLASRPGLSAQVTRLGFDVVEIRPRARYSLKTHEYLRSLGMSARSSRAVARALDVVVDRDLVFRNVFDLYARKPLA